MNEILSIKKEDKTTVFRVTFSPKLMSFIDSNLYKWRRKEMDRKLRKKIKLSLKHT